MDSEKSCGCKGIRTCLICEDIKKIQINGQNNDACSQTYTYCDRCKKAWSGNHDNLTTAADLGDGDRGCSGHTGDSLDFPGVSVIEEFVSREEEASLCDVMDNTPWSESQSGRRKQDYGPKVNFKKKKLRTACFSGFPAFSETLVSRMQQLSVLRDFRPVELCNLDYCEGRGSAIDPHFDDFWVWGPRLVTLTLLSGTRHRMTLDAQPDVEVFIPLPRRSLVVVQGPARYEWKHGILRQDISGRRVAMTFRELTPEFLEGGPSEDVGKELFALASDYNGVAVGARNTSNTATEH